MSKINDAQFWDILRKAGGIYAQAAKMIVEEIGEPYTRQAVKDRAERDPEQLADIREDVKDRAQSVTLQCLESGDEKIAYKAAIDLLRYLGKDRGYVERKEHDFTNGSITLNIQPASQDKKEKDKD